MKTIEELKVEKILKDYKIIEKNQKVTINRYPVDDTATYDVTIKVSTHIAVSNLYDKWKKMAYETNFQGNPYESNSFIKIHLKDENGEIIINPPVAKNGDRNWYEYKNRITRITITYIANHQ